MDSKQILGILLLVSVLLSCKTRTHKHVCIRVATLEYTWNNSYTIEQLYTGENVIINTQIIHPVGYFKINPNYTYDVFSDGVPHSGSWLINLKTCQLTLDHASPVDRSFTIDLLTKDSLIISRKDTLYHLIYKQYYVKNH